MSKKSIYLVVSLCCFMQNCFAADGVDYHELAKKTLWGLKLDMGSIHRKTGAEIIDMRMREEITFVERATPGGYGCELCYESMGKEEEALAELRKKPFFTKHFVHRERGRIKFESKPPEVFVYWQPTNDEKKKLYNLTESGYWDVAQYAGDDVLFGHLSETSLSPTGRLTGRLKTLLLVCGATKSDFDEPNWRRHDLTVDISRKDDF